MKIEFGKLYDADMIHPLEFDSARAIQSVPVYDWLGKQAAQIRKNLDDLPEAAARWFPVNRYTSPRLYALYRLALKRLNCAEEYPLFLKNGYDLTAMVRGSRSQGHMIAVNDACVETLDDGELLALFGQQIGHIRADHVQQTELLGLLEKTAGQIPMMGTLLGKKMWSYFADWLIASRFTADRAALFAAQSVGSVESLLLRQAGLDPRSPEAEAAKNQEVLRGEAKHGIYFIRFLHEMPTFGNIERIQTLRAWVRSEDMKRKYPQVYYQCRLEMNDAPSNAADESLLRLHAAALEGSANAALRLGDRYVRGDGLPTSTAAASCLFLRAAYGGDPAAMRYLIGFMRHGIEGMTDDKKTVGQLYRAALSRGLKASGADEFPPLPPNGRLDALAGEMEQKYGPLCDRDARTVRDAFWIPNGDTVFACMTEADAEGAVYGTAVASTGIYGRRDEGSLPFLVTWDEFGSGDLYSRETDSGWWLFSCSVPVLRKPESMRGTAAEMLLLLKSGKA